MKCGAAGCMRPQAVNNLSTAAVVFNMAVAAASAASETDWYTSIPTDKANPSGTPVAAREPGPP